MTAPTEQESPTVLPLHAAIASGEAVGKPPNPPPGACGCRSAPKGPHVRHIGQNGRPIGRTDGDIETIEAIGREDAGVVGRHRTVRRMSQRPTDARAFGETPIARNTAQEDYRPRTAPPFQGGSAMIDGRSRLVPYVALAEIGTFVMALVNQASAASHALCQLGAWVWRVSGSSQMNDLHADSDTVHPLEVP